MEEKNNKQKYYSYGWLCLLLSKSCSPELIQRKMNLVCKSAHDARSSNDGRSRTVGIKCGGLTNDASYLFLFHLSVLSPHHNCDRYEVSK